MKSFVREHGRTIVLMAVVTYAATIVAGGSIIATYAASIICMAIWLWWQMRKEKLS
jgi:hypothetical protein